MINLKPLNSYVLLELRKEEKGILISPDEDIREASSGTVINPGEFADIQAGDKVHFVWNAAHGNIKVIDGKSIAHVKHEHLISMEV